MVSLNQSRCLGVLSYPPGATAHAATSLSAAATRDTLLYQNMRAYRHPLINPALPQTGSLQDLTSAAIRYGPAALRYTGLVADAFRRFRRVYDRQAAGVSYGTPEALLHDLGLYNETQQSCSDYLQVWYGGVVWAPWMDSDARGAPFAGTTPPETQESSRIWSRASGARGGRGLRGEAAGDLGSKRIHFVHAVQCFPVPWPCLPCSGCRCAWGLLYCPRELWPPERPYYPWPWCVHAVLARPAVVAVGRGLLRGGGGGGNQPLQLQPAQRGA